MGKKRKVVLYLMLFVMFLSFSACNDKKKTEEVKENVILDPLIYHDNNILSDTLNIEVLDKDYTNPRLSIIIDDFGNYNNFMLDSLLVKFGELPKEVSFAILPNLSYSEFVMEYFQYDNRELLLHAPLEPQNSKINAGEVVINSEDDAITIINKMNEFHAQLPYISGVNNHMGSKATESPEVMSAILEWCQTNNLYFIDSATTSKSVAFALAQEFGVPSAKRDIFLDVPNPTKETVENYLVKMKKYFEANRDILVITHASSLERRDNLQYFITEAQKIGYKLVPVSEYITISEQPI